MTEVTLAATELVKRLREIVGKRHVLIDKSRITAFASGYRYGSGPALAVVRPGTPLEQFQTFCACVEAGVIVIVQAANTGLTGGSTPNGVYDRPVVIINTMRIKGIHYLQQTQQVVCLAGATLYELERLLAPRGREPHSVIGSSCIGASVVGGICNNSGGSLVRRGPAFTQLALFARVDEGGRVELVNHLGLPLGDDPEQILAALGKGVLPEVSAQSSIGAASGSDYQEAVRDIGADSPARYNANPAMLYEASGSAGKVMVLAVRLDTFPKDQRTATFYIGTDDPDDLTRLRRRMLSECKALPISGEYIHRDAFDVAAVYGKDVFVAIERLGTERLPLFFGIKKRVDAFARKFPLLPADLADRLLQWSSQIIPQHLPPRMLQWRDRFEHHLIVKVAEEGIEEARDMLGELFPAAGDHWFECTPTEATKAFLQRFAVASAAIRYRTMRGAKVGEIVALDIALRRNDQSWQEHLPPEIAGQIDIALYYAHFFCHVFHQDYVLKPGVDPVALEHSMWALLDARGARYPAEHNVGQLYAAGPEQAAHFRALDPCNQLNPGIGMTSRNACWH